MYELVLMGSGVRCVRRKFLLEFLAKELPSGTIKFSSKVVAIEESGLLKLVHLADGTSIKTKVDCVSYFSDMIIFSIDLHHFNTTSFD